MSEERAKAEYKKSIGVSAEGNPEFDIFYCGFVAGNKLTKELLVRFYVELMEHHYLNYFRRDLSRIIDSFVSREAPQNEKAE